MAIRDLLQMSGSNLFRRKIRTLLTILGVVIGTASIVVMLSLGLGLKRASMKQIEQSGGLTTIEVYPKETSESIADEDDKKARRSYRIDDEAIEMIARIPHVKLVSPVLEISALAKYRNFQAYITIKGMSQEAMQNMELKVGRGRLPISKETLQLFWGNQVARNFYSTRGNMDMPEIDAVKDQIFYIFDTDAYYAFQNQTPSTVEGEAQTPIQMPKKYLLPVCGVLAGSAEEYSNYSFTALADIDALKDHLKLAFKNKVIPAVTALLFAVLTGIMAAGFLPALRAMRLSPLPAQKNDKKYGAQNDLHDRGRRCGKPDPE